MFVTIPNRRGGTVTVKTLSIGVSRVTGERAPRLELFVWSYNERLVSALGFDAGVRAVDIAIGAAGTPDEGLVLIKRGTTFSVSKPKPGKPYYRFGFSLAGLINNGIPAISKVRRVWIEESKITVRPDVGEVLFVMPPGPIREILPKSVLRLIHHNSKKDSKGGNAHECK